MLKDGGATFGSDAFHAPNMASPTLSASGQVTPAPAPVGAAAVPVPTGPAIGASAPATGTTPTAATPAGSTATPATPTTPAPAPTSSTETTPAPGTATVAPTPTAPVPTATTTPPAPAAITPAATTTTTDPAPPIPGIKGLTFDDEFNTFSNSPDGTGAKWATTYPFGGETARTLPANNEAEFFSDPSVGENPFSVNNGVLTISATPAAPGSNPYNLPYDSGAISTQNSFAQQYGYFEMKAKLPAGAGLWPGFWMIPQNGSFSSELDILEQLGNNTTQTYLTVHDWAGGDAQTGQLTPTVPDTSAAFHTYGVDWEPTSTTFYEDGKSLGTVATPAGMNVPMIMMAQLSVGGPGSWPGAPTSSSEFPANMQIDYIRAYATAATTNVSGSAAIPAGGAAAPAPATDTAAAPAPDAAAAADPATASINTETLALGPGPQTMSFTDGSNLAITGGSGADTVTATSGTNTFTAGTGSMDITGGSGASNFVLHAGAGTMTIEDFLASKGDAITVDKALQPSFQQASDGQGGTLLTFGANQGSIDLIGYPATTQPHITFA